MPHALAIGASGMLASAATAFADSGWTVTMVARASQRLRAATAGGRGRAWSDRP